MEMGAVVVDKDGILERGVTRRGGMTECDCEKSFY